MNRTVIRTELLQAFDWLNSLAPTHLELFENNLIVRNFQRGSTICHEGDPADSWIGVLTGMVKLWTVAADKDVEWVIFVDRHRWFGEGSVLKNEPRKYNATAIRRSRIAYLPRKIFMNLLDNSIPFGRVVMNQLNDRVALTKNMITTGRCLHAADRVAYYLATLANPKLYPGFGSPISISQTELGKLVGMSRQQVNGALKTLKSAGLLEVQRSAITVLDLEGLVRFKSKDATRQ